MLAGNGNVVAQAQDTSTITSQIQATSLAVGGGTSQSATTSVSVGLSASRNDIDNKMQAYLQNVKQVTATNGDVHVSSNEAATIDATSRATAIQVAAGTQSSRAIGGGGATALNSITGEGNAFIMDSPVTATGMAANTGAIVLSANTAEQITAVVQTISVAVALSSGSNATPAISIGFSLAQNLIGSSGTGNSVGVEAYTQGSSLTAAQGIILSAASTATINATVDATSVAVAASTSSSAVGASAAGVETDNEIYLTIYAGIDGGTGVLTTQGNISVTAGDASTITSDAQAVSVTADLSGGGTAAGVSIGLSLAMNTIDNDVQAYITSAGTATASAGAIGLSTTEKSTITDTTTAASIAVGASSSSTGLALSGGGAVATNVILGGAQAYVQSTNLDSSGTTSLSAMDTSTITAQVLAISGSLSFGTSSGIAASIGAAVAENLIGYDTSGNSTPVPIEAYVLNSSVDSGGAYTVTAVSSETIMATTAAGSVAVAASSGSTGVGVSGSGVYVENEIADTVLAYDDGGTSTAGIIAPSISVSASDTSKITATAAAASLAASFGNTGVSISIGLSLATNQINDDVEAYIANAVTPVAPASIGVTTTSGGISLLSNENETINATSAAASLAVAGTLGTGVAISGAGAEATNTILGMDNAYVSASNLHSATSIALGAKDTSGIEAKIIAASASVGIGVSGAVGASIGVSVARNFIGNSVDTSSTAYDYLASANVLTLNPGDTVKIDSGARAGDIYQYLGQPVTVPFNYTAGTDSPSQVKPGQNVLVPSGVDGATSNTVYQYVGTLPLSNPNLATQNYAGPTVSFGGTLANGSSTVTGISSTKGLVVGELVSDPDNDIPAGTTIQSINSSSGTITLSAPATVSGSGSVTENLVASPSWHQITALQSDYSNPSLWRQINVNTPPLRWRPTSPTRA